MIPLQISFRDFAASEAISTAIEERVHKLSRLSKRISSCHVVVSSPHKHHLHGKIYHIQVQLHVPGEEISITREPELDDRHENVFIAISDAFGAVERKLSHYTGIKTKESRRKNAKIKRKATL